MLYDINIIQIMPCHLFGVKSSTERTNNESLSIGSLRTQQYNLLQNASIYIHLNISSAKCSKPFPSIFNVLRKTLTFPISKSAGLAAILLPAAALPTSLKLSDIRPVSGLTDNIRHLAICPTKNTFSGNWIFSVLSSRAGTQPCGGKGRMNGVVTNNKLFLTCFIILILMDINSL